jgi:phosphotransferase system enzyme I (PtsI)
VSFTLRGVGVSGGIAIGHAHLVSQVTLEVAHYAVPQSEIENEAARLDSAFNMVRAELDSLHASVSGPAAAEYGAFLDLHRMILDDSTLSVAAKTYVTQNQCNAEWAVTQQMNVLLEQFEQIEDDYLRERKTDVVQVVERVLKALLGHPGYVPPPVKHDGDSILVAHDLSPADVIQYKRHRFTAFLTDLGGLTSHTAIVVSISPPSSRCTMQDN